MDTPRKHDKYQRLLERARQVPAVVTAVAHPCDAASLTAAIDAAKAGLIAPILVGPKARIEDVARTAGLSIAGYQIVDAPHSVASAQAAVELVPAGQAECL